VRDRYGFTDYQDEDGFRYLKRSDGQSFLVIGTDMEDQLEADATRRLCLAWGLPPEDFGLPED
jgi:hypothetical protein